MKAQASVAVAMAIHALFVHVHACRHVGRRQQQLLQLRRKKIKRFQKCLHDVDIERRFVHVHDGEADVQM